jgi:hypothetical protein
MRTRSLPTFLLVILAASLGMLACDVSTLTTTLGVGAPSKPQVVIQSPLPGAQFREGDDVMIQSTSTDPNGIVRVELAVDGATVRTDAPPIAQGQISFSLVQRWKATAGAHMLSVRAYNASGAASDPALVSISVAPSGTVPPLGISPTTQVGLPPLGTTPTVIGIPATLTPGEPTVAPTTRPPTRPPPTATTITAPPGVWATAIRVEPKAPKRGQFVTFFVTFLNTTGGSRDYRWRIRIYEPDKKNSFGDTAPLNHTLPPGLAEFASADNWRVTGPGGCLDFIARAFAVDPETKQETEFSKPDQSGGPATGFQVCP